MSDTPRPCPGWISVLESAVDNNERELESGLIVPSIGKQHELSYGRGIVIEASGPAPVEAGNVVWYGIGCKTTIGDVVMVHVDQLIAWSAG